MNIKEIIPFQYNDVYHFSEGLALVYNDHECGFIDKTGTMKIPCKQGTVPVDNHYPFTLFGTGFKEGLASVSAKVDESLRYDVNRRYGFIDKSGNEIIPIKYDLENERRNSGTATYQGTLTRDGKDIESGTMSNHGSWSAKFQE